MQESQEFSKQFLNSIKTIDNVPCYVKLTESKFIILAIHQHLGLVQNFTEIITRLVQENASIIIPDLFCNISDEEIDQMDQFSLLKKLKMSEVYLILRKCVSYAINKKKIIILAGFSVGSSIGLKLIEDLQNISLGLFFYGYPSSKKLQPEKINCPIVIFHAQKDKVKHLSDEEHFHKVVQIYKRYENIKIERVDSSHGFMNPEHPNYDEKSFKYCRKMFHQYLRQIQTKQLEIKRGVKEEIQSKKQQEGGCALY